MAFSIICTIYQIIILNALCNIYTTWIWNKYIFTIYIYHLLLWQIRVSIGGKVLFLCKNLRFLYLICHWIPMISNIVWLCKSMCFLFNIMIKFDDILFIALNCLVIRLSYLNEWRMINLNNFLCIWRNFIFIWR